MHHVVFGELIGEEIANVFREEIGKRLEFDTRNRPFSLLDLYDNRSGDAELFCDLVLRHPTRLDRKSTRLNSSHGYISYADFCLKKKRKKRDEIESGKSYCSRRFGGATCDDKSAQIYARVDKNDWRIQPAEFYRFHDAEVNTFGYF